jgi:hypothetical protein
MATILIASTMRPSRFASVVAEEQYIPRHHHRKGQLILALGGAITCEVENAMLMVPPQYAVWIPGRCRTVTGPRRARSSAFCSLSRVPACPTAAVP